MEKRVPGNYDGSPSVERQLNYSKTYKQIIYGLLSDAGSFAGRTTHSSKASLKNFVFCPK